MVDLIRSATLAHFAEVARSVGIEPAKMLRRARLPLACLSDQNMRIAVESVRRLLEASATAAGVEDFGLRMAERGGLANMGTVGLVVREQATLGAAIEALARFIHIQSDAMRVEIERRDGVITIDMLLRIRHQRAKRQSIEYAVGRLHAIIRSLLGGDWRPLEVHFVHSPPRNRRHHRYFFGCDVIFDSDRDAILCAASDMSRPIPTAEPLIASYLRSRVEAIDVRPKAWDDKVGELVHSLLSNGLCTIERVAECLACDRRTIHRHLLDCGTSYSAILDAQRTDLVLRLIEDGNRPLAGIAELLGFSAQSAMARWFRGRFGCSVSQWRNGIRPKALTTLSSRGVASKSRSTSKTKRPPVSVRRSNRLGR
ncbi:AraC family transcriptional regulator [Bradyrhizobium sp.]|jgi:AraC-like DNA-binding protein|uniref:AraC family transcriptional regulator n=1 Tax=Bradyrhizobium sp. TaxID=376 RepID=UPI003D0FAB0A